jgi:DNA-directed RNA polymerase specialized sigma24 family protein
MVNVSPATAASVPAESLDALYRRHVPAARSLAFLLTGDLQLAEDLAHDAFVRTSARVSTLRDVELREQLWEALQSRPERQRAAVVLRYYDGRRSAEPSATGGGILEVVRTRAIAWSRRSDRGGAHG